MEPLNLQEFRIKSRGCQSIYQYYIYEFEKVP